MLQGLRQRAWHECHQILGGVHIPLGWQQCDAVLEEIGQGIRQCMRARPAYLGEGVLRAPWTKTHQPKAAIQSRAEYRICAAKGANPAAISAGPRPGMSLPIRMARGKGAMAFSMRRPKSPATCAMRGVPGGARRAQSARAPGGVMARMVRQRLSRAIGQAVAANMAR